VRSGGSAQGSQPAGPGVVVGSFNWSSSGENSNDENILIVYNQAIADNFAAEFNVIWNDLNSIQECTNTAAEGVSSSSCTLGNCVTACVSGTCCDGKDNDYDGNADAADTGCYDQGGASELYGVNCNDSVDNDFDGLTDAADGGCTPPATESNCTNNLDDDSDGYADELDADCSCNKAGEFGDRKIAFTAQQAYNAIYWVNTATSAQLSACTALSSSKGGEGAKIADGTPAFGTTAITDTGLSGSRGYTKVGSNGVDEGTSVSTTNHGSIDSVKDVTDDSKDNDLGALITCAPAAPQTCQ
jgi:hypothetical protein